MNVLSVMAPSVAITRSAQTWRVAMAVSVWERASMGLMLGRIAQVGTRDHVIMLSVCENGQGLIPIRWDISGTDRSQTKTLNIPHSHLLFKWFVLIWNCYILLSVIVKESLTSFIKRAQCCEHVTSEATSTEGITSSCYIRAGSALLVLFLRMKEFILFTCYIRLVVEEELAGFL